MTSATFDMLNHNVLGIIISVYQDHVKKNFLTQDH